MCPNSVSIYIYIYMMQVRSSPPPPPPQWLVAPQTCCFALFPSAPPCGVVWCGVVWCCLALFPSAPPPPPPVVWCGCARYCSSSDISGIIIIINNGWYPLKPVTPPCCGVVWLAPPCPPRGVVWLCPRPGPCCSSNVGEVRHVLSEGRGPRGVLAGGGGGYHWGGGGGGRRTRNRDHIYIDFGLKVVPT